MSQSIDHRVEAALRRAEEPLPLPSLHIDEISLYTNLIRQAAYLAKLKFTEEGDRAAIRAHYEIRRQEIAARLRVVELAIEQDHSVFKLLLANATTIAEALIQRGEVDAALEIQRRLFDAAPRNALQNIAVALGGNTFVKIR